MKNTAVALLALASLGLGVGRPRASSAAGRVNAPIERAAVGALVPPVGPLARHRRLKCPDPGPSWADADTTAPPGTKYETFPSEVARTRVSYLLYLPPGYDADPSRRYPVVYWLHGMCGHAWNGNGFVQQLDHAIRGRQAPAMIAVLVNGMADSYYFDSPDGRWPIESVIVKDLVPYIDRTYRTIARREARALEGFSMGGFGAAHLGFKFPDVFGLVVIDAPAFNSLETFRQGLPEISAKMFGDSTYFYANDPVRLVTRNADRLRGRTHIRIAVGDQDGTEEAAHELHMVLRKLGIDHELEVVPGVAHERQRFYDTLGARSLAFYAHHLGAD